MYLETLSKDVFIPADYAYAFNALETILFSINGLYKSTF